jgi:hypothetical protein
VRVIQQHNMPIALPHTTAPEDRVQLGVSLRQLRNHRQLQRLFRTIEVPTLTSCESQRRVPKWRLFDEGGGQSCHVEFHSGPAGIGSSENEAK